LYCIVLLYFAIRLESRKSANKRIYLSIYQVEGRSTVKDRRSRTPICDRQTEGQTDRHRSMANA